MASSSPRLDTKTETFQARIIAFLIDGVILGVAGGLFVGVGSVISSRLAGLFGAIFGLLTIVYFMYLEGTSGQTLGKRVMGIKVVKSDGSPSTMGASAIRNLLRVIDTLPTLYILGIILILVSEDNQRLGDMVGNTVVVRSS